MISIASWMSEYDNFLEDFEKSNNRLLIEFDIDSEYSSKPIIFTQPPVLKKKDKFKILSPSKKQKSNKLF